MAQRTCTVSDCERKHMAKGLCGWHYNQARYTVDQRHPKRLVECVMCGRQIVRRADKARLDSHCCSVECRHARQFGTTSNGGNYDWNHDARQRAKSFGCQIIEDVDRLAVLERDGWRCYLCGKNTSVTEDPFSPDSATVDHVIALSRGGEHTMRNVRCACLACNSSKAGRDAA